MHYLQLNLPKERLFTLLYVVLVFVLAGNLWYRSIHSLVMLCRASISRTGR